MKHQAKIVGILLGMFVITQLIGLVVIDAYSNPISTNYTEDGIEKQRLFILHKMKS